MDEFNQQFGHKLVWVPWQRPGFELAMMLGRAVKDVPGCDGVVLGGHGLFTWGHAAGIVSEYHHHHRSDWPVHRGLSIQKERCSVWRRKVQTSRAAAGDCYQTHAVPAWQCIKPAAHDW